MKRKLCLSVLIATLALPAAAPIPIVLANALKCVAIAVIGETAYIIHQCNTVAGWYLIRVREDSETDYWLASRASAATVAKNEGWLRCEGPMSEDEAKFRAWVNNQEPTKPMYPCGPLGTIPGPTYTNYNVIKLQSSTDGGKNWSDSASAQVQEGETGVSFAVLPATGTNNMTRAQILEVLACDAVTTNASPAAMFRFRYEQ